MTLDEALSVMERAGLRGKVAYADEATLQALAQVFADLDAAHAQLTAARPLVEEVRSMANADCDCLQCVRIGALLAAYDATQAEPPSAPADDDAAHADDPLYGYRNMDA